MFARFAGSCAIPNLPARVSATHEANFSSYSGWVYFLRFRLSRPPSNRPHHAARRTSRVPGSSLSARMTLGNGRNHSLHARNGANIPASPYGLGDLERMEHAKLANGRGHELPIGRSPPRPSRIRWTRRGRPVRRRSGRRPPPERPSLHNRSGKRWLVSRNQTSWFAAIAGATTWLRVSSSGGIADAATVSVNAIGRRHGRGRRRSRSSLATT